MHLAPGNATPVPLTTDTTGHKAKCYKEHPRAPALLGILLGLRHPVPTSLSHWSGALETGHFFQSHQGVCDSHQSPRHQDHNTSSQCLRCPTLPLISL